jgi:hypothetical protein
VNWKTKPETTKSVIAYNCPRGFFKTGTFRGFSLSHTTTLTDEADLIIVHADKIDHIPHNRVIAFGSSDELASIDLSSIADLLFIPFTWAECRFRILNSLNQPKEKSTQQPSDILEIVPPSLQCTIIEEHILSILLRQSGKPVHRDSFMEQGIDPGSLDVHICNLRKKLQACHSSLQIHGLRGFGYILVAV